MRARWSLFNSSKHQKRYLSIKSQTTNLDISKKYDVPVLPDIKTDDLKETYYLELRDDPVTAYKNFESNPYEAPESLPLLLKIIADLKERLQAGSVLELESFKHFRMQLLELSKESVELLERHIPLSDLNAFIIKYIECMDKLFRSADPDLQGTYHRNLAKGYMKSLMNTKDGTRMFFTTHAVDELYFLHIRPAAIYLNWIIELPPFTANAQNYQGGPLVPTQKLQRFLDGLMVDFEEITKHDLGHAFFMKRQDKWLFDTSSLSRLELVKEWTKNKNHILYQWMSLEQTDPDLAKAVRFILFEVIHDKGYQFDLPILRQQFHSPKWIDIIHFKEKNGYFSENGLTDAVDIRLSEARIWLVNLVEQLIKEENLQKIEKLGAQNTPVVIKQWKQLENHTGVPIKLEVNGVRDFKVQFDVADVGLKSTSLYVISLVLAPTAKEPILTAEKIDRLEKWIWQKKNSGLVDSLVLNSDGEVTIKMKAQGALKQAPEILSADDRLTEVELYKLERLLNLIANKIPAPFTITEPPVQFTGKITSIDSAKEQVHLVVESGATHIFPLVEISVQARFSLNISHPDRYINLNPEDRFLDANVLRNSYIHYGQSMNVSAPPFVTIDNKYELSIVDTHNPLVSRAISSVLTRSLEDAKYTNGGYLPPKIVERVQSELISPYGITHLWGKAGHRLVLSCEASEGQREIKSTVLIHRSRDGIFFFTSQFNNLQHSTLGYDLDFDYSADGNPEHRWFNKFCFPEFTHYKPKGFHHFANFVVEREGTRGQGLARLMINEIVKNYSIEYIQAHGGEVQHSQKLFCGKGLWQIGDPPWLARMKKLGFYQRLGSETFHIPQGWDPLIPTYDKDGNIIDNIAYNKSFGMPEIYENEVEFQKIYQNALKDSKGDHLFFRIPKVIKTAQSGNAKLQYFQLLYPFTRE